MGHAEEEQVQAPDAPKSRSLLQSILLITACTMTMLVNLSNSTAPSIALPTIGRELSIPENQLQWIISAYSLTSGCLLLFFGRVADLHGRRRTFIAGMLWLVAFTIGCGFCSGEDFRC
ncbi:hypothetical protein ONZ45_g15560 [Pleurotus djamor]|nr:hypothetical protein ONZ45_g15560 [Pleurotus djamor]